MMNDDYKYKGLRKKLVEEIRRKGISDAKVLAVMEKVPRHFFMDPTLEKFFYEDNAYPIDCGQTISQPYTVAFQTELLNIQKNDKILEIGTGSGYQTAILVEMGAKVFTIERQRDLFLKSQALLNKLGYPAQCFYGDGYLGQPNYGPFDKVLITAGAPYIPEDLLKQMKIGGFLVAPVGGQNAQIMTMVTKLSETEFEKKEFGNFVFVPMLKGKS